MFPNCPIPNSFYDTIQLAHGAGGRFSAELVSQLFLPAFGNEFLNCLEDQARLDLSGGRVAFTTDSFVVAPLFFPGGDIGELAVNGTVNDLAMAGAVPKYLSLAFILEEGLAFKDLQRIVASIQRAAASAGVTIVTGDTKVVPRGKCDRIFINTSGVGVIPAGLDLGVHRIKAGDAVILSGSVADHGMAVMTVREGLSFENEIASDTAALNELVQVMLNASSQIHAMRDPTRGGVAATLNEFAKAARFGIRVFENRFVVRDSVRGACEVLGIDPLTVANEGKLVAIVAASDAERVLASMQSHPLGKEARIVGEVLPDHAGQVMMRTLLGVDRLLDMPLGELLPRIC